MAVITPTDRTRLIPTREQGLLRVGRDGEMVTIRASSCELRLTREEAWRLAEAVDSVATEA